jgi:hypothetical protein
MPRATNSLKALKTTFRGATNPLNVNGFGNFSFSLSIVHKPLQPHTLLYGCSELESTSAIVFAISAQGGGLGARSNPVYVHVIHFTRPGHLSHFSYTCTGEKGGKFSAHKGDFQVGCHKKG